MMAAHPPATTAGPRPNGMISAPLPESAQPLPDTFERLSTIVRIQRRTPAIMPRRAISPAKPGSRLGSVIDPAIQQEHATFVAATGRDRRGIRWHRNSESFSSTGSRRRSSTAITPSSFAICWSPERRDCLPGPRRGPPREERTQAERATPRVPQERMPSSLTAGVPGSSE